LAPHDGLVGLHHNAGQIAHQPAGGIEHAGVDASGHAKHVAAGLQRHHHFLQRSVARAFADAVDGALHLASAIYNAHQRVGRGHPQIVVAVHGNGCLVNVGYVLGDAPDQRAPLLGSGVTRGVGDVDHRRTGINHCLQNAVEVLRVGPAGVLCIVLHVLHKAFGVLDRLHALLQCLLARGPQLVFDVHVGHAQAGVDTRSRCPLQRFGRLRQCPSGWPASGRR